MGSFEAQLIAGKLTSSGYSLLVPGQPGNHDPQAQPKSNDWRYLSGLVVTYQPKWVPGLFLGLTRTFQVYEKDMGHGFSDYLPVISPFLKDNYYNAQTGEDTDDAAKRDQLASLFARWLWPAANAEIYFEFGKEDHNWNTRDLLLDPEHSRAYIVGFRKLFKINKKQDENVQVSVEFTQLAKPADDIVERDKPARLVYQWLCTVGLYQQWRSAGCGYWAGRQLAIG